LTIIREYFVKMCFSTGELWKTNRRFALHTLRDFGFGRNLMEAKIMKHTDWLVDQFQKNGLNGNAFNPADSIQLAVGSFLENVLL
jgi:cytochrome P450 family 2 subfamily J